MKNFVLIYTCYWIALLSEDNLKEHDLANEIAEIIENQNLIIPYPTLYEFINSKLSRKEQRIKFEDILKKPNIIRISDEKYKEQALDNFFNKSRFYTEDVSLVDEVIKLMLIDKSLKIDYLVTFDKALQNSAISLGKQIV